MCSCNGLVTSYGLKWTYEGYTRPPDVDDFAEVLPIIEVEKHFVKDE